MNALDIDRSSIASDFTLDKPTKPTKLSQNPTLLAENTPTILYNHGGLYSIVPTSTMGIQFWSLDFDWICKKIHELPWLYHHPPFSKISSIKAQELPKCGNSASDSMVSMVSAINPWAVNISVYFSPRISKKTTHKNTKLSIFFGALLPTKQPRVYESGVNVTIEGSQLGYEF